VAKPLKAPWQGGVSKNWNATQDIANKVRPRREAYFSTLNAYLLSRTFNNISGRLQP
jgi:hypothetical protein